MSSKYLYSKLISNKCLNVSKEIKAMTEWELDIKCSQQIEKWKVLEQRKKERERIDGLKGKAELMNTALKEEAEKYQKILEEGIKNTVLDWESQKSKGEYSQFTFNLEKPSIESIKIELNIPKKSILEYFIRSKAQKRINLENEAINNLSIALERYENTREEAYLKWKNGKEKFEKKQRMHNEYIDQWKKEFESGERRAVEKYMKVVLSNSSYPDIFPSDINTQYDDQSKMLIISMELPNFEKMPKVKEYKYVANSKSIKEVLMKEKEIQTFYDDIIKQTAIRTIYEIFTADYAKNIKSIVFNGWVNGVDKATGQDFTSCIISVLVSLEIFGSINFERIKVSECINNLKAVYAGNLANLAPIKPIMDIDRNDDRFIESRDIISSYNSGQNLAVMPWEDFEHLVRQLFSEYFSQNGCEVKVTQSSRDGGVDAIAFDPDPIRGGKYVIQAKRYNKVVPVSAVRDLYGTMINEGAVKGILVTTSYYGNDSREFAKDKPISLIDGSNLIQMFSEFGHNFHIRLQK